MFINLSTKETHSYDSVQQTNLYWVCKLLLSQFQQCLEAFQQWYLPEL